MIYIIRSLDGCNIVYVETREEAGDGNVSLTTADIHLEYYALSNQWRAYWEFMHEL